MNETFKYWVVGFLFILVLISPALIGLFYPNFLQFFFSLSLLISSMLLLLLFIYFLPVEIGKMLLELIDEEEEVNEE